MAIPQIGAYTFMTIRTTVPARATKVRDITRPGVAGTAFVETSESADEQIIYTQGDHGSAALRNTALSNFEALIGTLATISDEYGRSSTNVMIRDVKEVSTQTMALAVGGRNSGDHLLTCMWRVQKS